MDCVMNLTQSIVCEMITIIQITIILRHLEKIKILIFASFYLRFFLFIYLHPNNHLQLQFSPNNKTAFCPICTFPYSFCTIKGCCNFMIPRCCDYHTVKANNVKMCHDCYMKLVCHGCHKILQELEQFFTFMSRLSKQGPSIVNGFMFIHLCLFHQTVVLPNFLLPLSPLHFHSHQILRLVDFPILQILQPVSIHLFEIEQR
jgi:hypothetical protein